MKWYTLDFETKSRVDLIQQGLDNYVSCPEFDAIVCVVKDRQTQERFTASAYGDTELTIYDLLYPLLADPSAQFIAHNALFEYAVCCILAKRWGLEQPTLSRFHCSSLSGAAVGLPAGLDKVAHAVLGARKVASGKVLITLFTMPDKKTGEFNTNETHPEQWAEFLYYAEVDVDLADEVYDALPAVSPETRTYWLATARMNLRGFLLDLNVVDMVLEDVEMIKADAAAVTKAVTKGLVSKPTERKKLLNFLNERGFSGKSLTSDIVMGWIRDTNTPEDIIDLLWARLSASKSTFGKYAAFRRYASPDWRSRHSFWANGTHTGRLAGKGVQPQNITYDKQGKFPSAPELLAMYLEDSWPEEWDRTEALVAMTRAVIMADEGHVLYDVDYSAIEARIQVWLANVTWALRKYAKNEDLYKPMAAIIFGIKVEDVTKPQRNGYGKVTVLGCGYGMGYAKFAKQYNKTEAEAKRCVYAYRNTYSQVQDYWGLLESAFKACLILNRATKCQAPKAADGTIAPVIRFRPDSIGGVPYVVCTPPGGREIWYRNPKAGQDGDLSYERITNKTTFRMKLWGGILLENICQNIAGVIISRAMINVEMRGAPPVLQVHDQLTCEVKPTVDVQVLDEAMVDIKGFPGLPLSVESDLIERFGK